MQLMRRSLVLAGALALSAGPVAADRVLMAPAGRVLDTASVKAEGLASTSDVNDNLLWLQAGTPTLELQALRDSPEQGSTEWGFGVQAELIPGTSFIPGVSVGIRDVGDDTRQGRAFYGAVGIPLPVKYVPIPGVEALTVNLGVGTDSINGVFGSLEMDTNWNVRLLVEHDSHNLNLGAEIPLGEMAGLRAVSLGGDFFVGLRFQTGPSMIGGVFDIGGDDW